MREKWLLDYDITIGSYQTTYNGGTNDVFVTMLFPGSPMSINITSGRNNQTVWIDAFITEITYAGTDGLETTFNSLPAGVTGILVVGGIIKHLLYAEREWYVQLYGYSQGMLSECR